MALKTCRVCGITANNPQELESFKKHKHAHLGIASICKKCNQKQRDQWRKDNPEKYEKQKQKHREYMKTNRLRTIRRKELIDKIGTPLICYFCGKVVSIEETPLHSLDRNHENWADENKVPTHAKCHGRYHRNTHHPLVKANA